MPSHASTLPLPLPPFAEAAPADYAAVGFKCGLEVHQQLLTRRKLFCRCPAGHYSAEHDAEILRHMRPTLSEMGEYDGTALMEKKTRKNIIYRIHHATVCTYEFDDTPPFQMDDQAIDIALETALLLRLNIVDELHVARKQYLDGSIPAGFQRTTILGVDGWIPFGDPAQDRRIGVRQLGLEEDSCREVSDSGHDRVYLTDRLGMPLVEVVTEPDMTTPHEAAAACELIRKLLRSTQKVRRGYGATRQDVNVSVAGGTRTEIKGVPQIWRIPRLVHNEACRQLALLAIRDELQRRGVREDTLLAEHEDVTDLLARSTFAPLRVAIDAGHRARCVRLAGFAGLFNAPTQEHTTFAKEFADRVRVIACLTELPNMVHSDLGAESPWPQDWIKLRKRMRAGDRDVLAVVWGSQRDTLTACEEIAGRAREATVGVPSDTRQALKDDTNGFERVLPGPERMYPDTDLPPIALNSQRVERVRAAMPEFVWETEARFRAGGMVPHDAGRLCISPRCGLVSRAIAELGLRPSWLGALVAQRMRAFRREGLRPERLADDALWALLEAHAAGRLAREGVAWIIERLLRERPDGPVTAADARRELDAVEPLPAGEAAEHVRRALAEASARPFATPAALGRHVMGRLMDDLVGRVEGARLAAMVEQAGRGEPIVETLSGKRVAR